MWKIYRHKDKDHHNIRYWVEHDDAGAGWRMPKVREGLDNGAITRLVRIKACRNVRFDEQDLPFTHTPESGLWPMEKFLELYEPEPEEAA